MTLNVGEFTQLLSESLAPDRTLNLWCEVPLILLTFEMCCYSSTTVGDCWIEKINQKGAKLRESCFGTQGPYQVCKSWIITSPAEFKSGQSYRRLIDCQAIPRSHSLKALNALLLLRHAPLERNQHQQRSRYHSSVNIMGSSQETIKRPEAKFGRQCYLCHGKTLFQYAKTHSWRSDAFLKNSLTVFLTCKVLPASSLWL